MAKAIMLYKLSEASDLNILGPRPLDLDLPLVERKNPQLASEVNATSKRLLNDPHIRAALGKFITESDNPGLAPILAHQIRVGKKAHAVAKTLGLYNGQEEDIHVGGLLHDCFKQEILEIINVPSRLGPENMPTMQFHTIGGSRKVIRHTGNETAAGITLVHHLDQHNPYPVLGTELAESMTDYEISLLQDSSLRPLGNIVSIADQEDAASSERPESPRMHMLDAYSAVQQRYHVGNTYPLDVLFAEVYGFDPLTLVQYCGNAAVSGTAA